MNQTHKSRSKLVVARGEGDEYKVSFRDDENYLEFIVGDGCTSLGMG